ncbi:MAG TPA: ribulose-phosphate 3-epimerase [Candidatus Nanoarchaeia archaeon]|nr:ribulose-phosphate 3-epimerase [Candidatus Nanoarchaeia archaeon]
MNAVVPSVFAIKAKEYAQRFNRVSSMSKRIHVDVMDGKFVPRKSPSLIFLMNKGNEIDVHLMAEDPLKYAEEIQRLKAKRVFIHFEIKNFIEKFIDMREKGFSVGIAIKPKTKISEVIPYIKFADCFLVMAVAPGKEGQKFIFGTEKKVKELRKETDKEILVDGGINEKTIKKLKKMCGVAVGSYLSNSENPKKEIEILKKELR